MTKITYKRNKDYLEKVIDTGTKPNVPATIKKYEPFRLLCVGVSDSEVSNDTDTETVTISVVDGLEVARGSDPADATVLDYDGELTLSIDGVETTKTLSNGTVSFDLTTEKPAGSTITIKAESLADHPSESDSVDIEVVST